MEVTSTPPIYLPILLLLYSTRFTTEILTQLVEPLSFSPTTRSLRFVNFPCKVSLFFLSSEERLQGPQLVFWKPTYTNSSVWWRRETVDNTPMHFTVDISGAKSHLLVSDRNTNPGIRDHWSGYSRIGLTHEWDSGAKE